MQQEHSESAREWRIARCKSDQYYNNNSINQSKSVSLLTLNHVGLRKMARLQSQYAFLRTKQGPCYDSLMPTIASDNRIKHFPASVRMYTRMCVCLCICLHVCVPVYLSVCVCACARVPVWMHVCVCDRESERERCVSVYVCCVCCVCVKERESACVHAHMETKTGRAKERNH